jgi:hypothetical protein
MDFYEYGKEAFVTLDILPYSSVTKLDYFFRPSGFNGVEQSHYVFMYGGCQEIVSMI